MARKLAPIAVTLFLLGAIGLFAPAAGAKKPCPVKYCTTPAGEYVLNVPPLSSNPFLAEFADCVWNVHVDFGDGTEHDYVFDGSIGLTGSHVFPTPGVVYTVQVKLRDGHPAHPAPDSPTCLNVDQSSEVLYRTPDEEADDPPPVDEEPPAWVPTGSGGTTPDPIPVAADTRTPNELAATGPTPASDTVAYWRHCRGSVLTHLVSCAKGRKVAGGATGKLSRPGSARVGSFSCRLPAGGLQPIVCVRGLQRVLAPLP